MQLGEPGSKIPAAFTRVCEIHIWSNFQVGALVGEGEVGAKGGVQEEGRSCRVGEKNVQKERRTLSTPLFLLPRRGISISRTSVPPLH